MNPQAMKIIFSWNAVLQSLFYTARIQGRKKVDQINSPKALWHLPTTKPSKAVTSLRSLGKVEQDGWHVDQLPCSKKGKTSQAVRTDGCEVPAVLYWARFPL